MDTPKPTVIKVLGLGGGGSNAVNRMIELGLEGVEFIAANTDAQALSSCLAPTRLQLGPRLTRGLGAGGQPQVGEAAAEESRQDLKEALAGADMVFLTAGLGGGTGTGAVGVAAEVARSVGALAVAVVTTPFSFEATQRRKNADYGLSKLRPHADTLITVPNDKLLNLLNRNVTFELSLRVADEVLRQGVQGVTELINKPGLINVDFAHIRTVMQLPGRAMLAIGQGRGEHKAEEAIQQALQMPLLESGSVKAASGLLVHITGGDDLSLFETSQAVQAVTSAAPNADIIFGATLDPLMTGRAQAILVATGLPELPTATPFAPRVVTLPAAAPKAHTPPTGAEPQPAGQLAEALFNRALSPKPAEKDEPAWSGSEAHAPAGANLDVPAFLRRRRSLREIEKG